MRISIIAAVLLLGLIGCSGHHGTWQDGRSFLWATDDSYVLENGERCGEVTRGDGENGYYAWVHGGSNGEWSTLEQAKHAVQSDWRCR